jgi:LPS O-antigen subunit length determinant protein (WzzB/FepE family)
MSIMERHDLYRSERAQSGAERLINRMRGDIGIQLISHRVVQVSFTSAETRQAQQVARDLVSELVEANLHEGVGVVQVIDPPDELVVSVRPRRVAAAGLGGLVGGALIGTLIALVLRRPTQPAS